MFQEKHNDEEYKKANLHLKKIKNYITNEYSPYLIDLKKIDRQQKHINQTVPSFVKKIKNLPYVFFADFFEKLEDSWPLIHRSHYDIFLELMYSILKNVSVITENLAINVDYNDHSNFIYMLSSKKYFENVRKLLKKIYSFKGNLSNDQRQLFETMIESKYYYSMIPYFSFLRDEDIHDYGKIYQSFLGNHKNFQQFKKREESDVDYFEYMLSGGQKKNIGFGILGTIIVGLGVVVLKLSKK